MQKIVTSSYPYTMKYQKSNNLKSFLTKMSFSEIIDIYGRMALRLHKHTHIHIWQIGFFLFHMWEFEMLPWRAGIWQSFLKWFFCCCVTWMTFRLLVYFRNCSGIKLMDMLCLNANMIKNFKFYWLSKK